MPGINPKNYTKEVMAVPCPPAPDGCGQKAFERCISMNGGITQVNPHKARRDAAAKTSSARA